MPFNTALSGIRAASTELSVAGNNIANASTTGFKQSRVEFSDVYATSGGGSVNIPGAGVQVQDISQSFSQGNVTFTENQLDLAINGNGFFVVNQDGETNYTRAGVFGLDNEGYVVGSTGARLQGFESDDFGNVSGVQSDIQVEISNLAPRQTTGVDLELNLNSTDVVLQSTGKSFTTEGNAIGDTKIGLKNSTTSGLTGGTFTLPMNTIDFTTDSIDFDVTLSASSGNNGTVSVSLDSLRGVPAAVQTFNDVRTLATAINAQIFSPAAPQDPIDISATAVDLGGGNYTIEFTALRDGESSSISLSAQNANAAAAGLDGAGTLVQGEPAVNNGYPAQSVDFTSAEGNVFSYTSAASATAAEIAAELNSIEGVSASSTAQATITAYNNASGNMSVTLNGVTLDSGSLAELASDINILTNSTLPGISADVDPGSGLLVLNSVVGDDLTIEIDSPDDGDSLSVQGSSTSTSQTLEVDNNNALSSTAVSAASDNAIVIGGSIDITLEEGYAVGNETPLGQVFQLLGDSNDPANTVFSDVVINAFDPTDQSTFNSSTSMTVFDSLGNSHIMTQYYVKQPFDPNDATTSSNNWEMHILIDGEDVGDPDIADPTVPTRATYNLFFGEDGALNQNLSDDILVSNWVPKDENGDENGALGPQNVLAGGSAAVTNPPVNSNFVVDLTGTTQFGSDFSVNDVAQNGYTTGRLSGMSIDDSGIIFARFTNGESQVLGQIALADFANQEGLQPVGNSMWVENFASGAPNIGTPNSASLGGIQSGALEESNVDLSEQLVDLIIAQRNFQASAKTIETASQTTDTIINLR